MDAKVREIFQAVVRAGVDLDRIAGAYDEDIDAMAAEQGVPAVPAAVRALFSLIGIEAGPYAVAGAIGPGGVRPRDKRLALELVGELPGQAEQLADPPHMLVMVMHENEVFSIIDGSQVAEPTPPVWLLHGDYKLERRWGSVTEWFSAITDEVVGGLMIDEVVEISEWRPVPSELYAEWREVFNRDWSGAEVESACPVCESKTLRRWYALDEDTAMVLRGVEFSGQGRLWEWCSSCQVYETFPDGYVPGWWSPPYQVDDSALGHDPHAIECARLSHLRDIRLQKRNG
ncbi:hypothetical protein GFY24_01600 [Nocardia sp. SYP-A9097]|uniref:hypothetical protein n=1 Tax=Nocardia sp. SYP-A9097 TaxID=2663237 RepID=UPI00129A8EF3|nr:hypothetical protein [Nocardia sp. SYP-A9097]MRH86170.1 hypothetical protein [Nocardia sp. SYP-A9097]